MRYNSVQQGSVCPKCSSYKTENLVREYFEKKISLLLDTEIIFKKQKPSFLEGLEFDGYNSELNIAFEYNGKQHYEWVPYFQKTIEKFYKQQERDIRKRNICKILWISRNLRRRFCKERNIRLLDIPYEFDYHHEKKLFSFIDIWIKENVGYREIIDGEDTLHLYSIKFN